MLMKVLYVDFKCYVVLVHIFYKMVSNDFFLGTSQDKAIMLKEKQWQFLSTDSKYCEIPIVI